MVRLIRRAFAAFAGLMLIALWLPALLTSSAAAGTTLPTSTPLAFEDADGNMAVDGAVTSATTPEYLDWASAYVAPTLANVADAPCSDGSDTIFSATKEDDTSTTVACQSSTPKVDLQRIYGWHQAVGGDNFLYLAWEAPQQAGSNNNHIDFELNQDAQPALPNAVSGNKTWTLDRQPGDLLFDFDITPATPTVLFSKWVTSGSCDNQQDSPPCWAPKQSLGSAVQAAVGGGFTDPVSHQAIATGAFGEMGVNLNAAGLFTAGTCTDFASFWAKGRSSGSGGTSEMKDFVAPNTLTVSNCGTIVTKKTTVPSGSSQSFAFNVTGGPTANQQHDSFSLVDGGSHTTSDVRPSDATHTYTDSETLPAGWTATSGSCSNNSGTYDNGTITGITVTAGETVTCSFVNTKQAKLVVAKQTDPSSATDKFGFSGSSGVGTIPDLGNGESWTSGWLAPGTYTVQEAQQSGWDLTGLTCSGDTSHPSSGSVATRTATYDLQPGETVTCTFTNTEQGTLTVKKVSDPAGGTGFSFTSAVPALTGTIDDGGTLTATHMAAGTYTVTETDKSGYSLADIACTGDNGASNVSSGDVASATATFRLDPGEALTCTFSNTALGRIIVSKTTTPSSDTTTSFDFSSVGPNGTTGPNTYSHDFSLTNGQSDDTGATLAPGTYNVSEDTLPAGWQQTSASCSTDGVSGTFAPSSIDLAAGQVVRCEFANTHYTSLTLNKTVVGNGDTAPAGGFVFDVSCDGQHVASPVFTDTGSQSIDGLVVGSSCTVTETQSDGWTTTPSLSQQVTLGASDNSVSFTNTRDTGVITVTKTLEGAAAGASTVFTFDVLCPGHDAFDQKLILDAALNSSVSSTAIPTGFACTVNEESTSGWQQTTPATGGVDVTVPGTAAFTNTRLTGPLQLAKSVAPTTGSYTAGDPSNTLTYTLSLSPTGALDHTGVVVTDYLPGFDPADTTSGKTTYVADSATCSTGCTASYDATTHQLSWAVGDVAHDAAAVVMTYKVTIDQPKFDPTVGLPIETIDNTGYVQSVQQARTPSNQVKTPVAAVLGVKVVRKPPKKLPFTGLGLPVGTTVTAAVLMLVAGVGLTSAARRRRS